MSRHARWAGPAALFAAAAAAVVGLITWVDASPDETTRLRDDAFYEFAFACNVASGRGPTVSDGTTTSGVQWLWSLLLTPLAAAFGPASLPRIAPWIGLALHAVAAALWWRGSRDRLAGAVLGLCWLGHPLLLREAQNGQETALASLCATLLWLGRGRSEPAFVGLGVLAALARTDLLALVLALSVWRRGVQPRALLAPVAAWGATVVPNVAFGSGVLPDSALPMSWLWHANFAATAPAVLDVLRQHWWYLRPVLLGGPFANVSVFGCAFAVFVLARPSWPASLRVAPAVAVGAAAALGASDLEVAGVLAALLALFPRARRDAVPRDLLAVVVGLGSIVALHWAVRWYPRDYYLAPVVVVAFAAVQRHARPAAVLLVFALAQLASVHRLAAEPLAGQAEMTLAGRCLADVLPAGERVGCFNSGLVTFHADVLASGERRRAVVNLDGVVDARSFAALRRAALGAWLDEQGVRFVLDGPGQFATDPRLPHACGRWIAPDFDPSTDLVEVARFEVPDAGEGVRLYWRRGRGGPPEWRGGARVLRRDPDGTCHVAWPAGEGQFLAAEMADGSRRELVRVDVPTVVVVAIAPALSGTGRLFVADAAEPLLELR